jgi:hypothetical protein
MPGHLSFTELIDCLFRRFPNMERGIAVSDVQAELFNFIERYLGREPATIGSEDAQVLVAHFEKWFAAQALSRRVFVPCVISRTPAARFEIGPILF